jgi:hypothetical protein
MRQCLFIPTPALYTRYEDHSFAVVMYGHCRRHGYYACVVLDRQTYSISTVMPRYDIQYTGLCLAWYILTGSRGEGKTR